MNYGYQNEYDFVELFNDKYFDELSENAKKCLDFTSPHICCLTICPKKET